MRLSKLKESLSCCQIVYDGERWERDIVCVADDSRQACEGALFVCLTGGRVDGHAYAKEAIKKGAMAIVTERKLDVGVPQLLVNDTRDALARLAACFYGNPAERLKMIAVTGTNGKTTTANMLAAILKEAGKNVGVIGTLGICYADKQIPSSLTTPDPLYLHKTLAEMFLDGVEYVVMEVSAHALYYKKTAGIPFVASIFTNVSQDHLDFFQTMEKYKRAKSRLFLTERCPLAVMNGDEETGREWGKEREKQGFGKTVYYGLITPTDCFAVITDENTKQTQCMLNVSDEIARLCLSFTGRHNVYNALAATACAYELGIDVLTSAKGLSALTGVNGRLQWIDNFEGADIFVDFAHTPDGLEKTLSALKAHCKGNLICVFGCGGNRDKTKRPLMGECVAKGCNFAVLTSDNPRYEDPLDIIVQIEQGYRRYSTKYVVVPDRYRAIEYALNVLKKGDILLVAGKGGERYQEVMGIKYPFDDNAIIAKIIREKRESLLL